jgi:hypothetical protein
MANFQAIPIVKNGKVIGRYIERNDYGVYIDYSEYRYILKCHFQQSSSEVLLLQDFY